jgi:iron complex outermembrane receptor protein
MNRNYLAISSMVLFFLIIDGSTLGAAETADLGVIKVESSTIDIKKEGKTEVSSVSTIDEETIEVISPKHINELLQSIPGITASVRAGEVVQIHMRGVAQQEFMGGDKGVVIVIDGVPVQLVGGRVRINLAEIASIKVVKGSASYLYGASALGGAVIITTKKPKHKNEYSVNAETGSYGYRDFRASVNQSYDKFSFNVNVNYRYTDGYWEDSEQDNKSISGKFQYFIDDHSEITFAADITDKHDASGRLNVRGVTAAKENPSGVGDAIMAYSSNNMVDLDKYFINYARDFDNGSDLMVSGYYYNDLYDYLSSPYDSNGDAAQDTYGRQNNKDLVHLGIKAEYRISMEKTALMVGVDVGQATYDDRRETIANYSTVRRGRATNYYNGEYSQLSSKEDKYAVYAELKNSITSKLTTTLNARYDHQKFDYKVENNDYSIIGGWSNTQTTKNDAFQNGSYRAGLAYAFNDRAILFSSISTGFRVPTISQKYAGDFDAKRTNNPNLGVQTAINYEIGLRGDIVVANNKLGYEVSLFQLDTKDIISKESGTYSGSANWGQYANVGDARSRGLELSLKSDQEKTVSFNLAYTYLDAFYTRHDPFIANADSNGDGIDDVYNLVGYVLPRTSNHTASLFINYKPINRLTFIAEGYAKSSYYPDETNQVELGGYAFLNLQARYNMKIKENNLELFAKVDNVFDNQYFRAAYLHTDRDGDNILTGEDVSIFVDPGRVYYVGMKYTF